MKELLQKNYEFKVLDQIFLIKQLSMRECIEFHYKFQEKDFNVVSFVFVFLKDKISITEKDLLKIDIKKIFDLFVEYWMKDFYSKWKSKWWESVPYESYIAFIVKELWIWVNELLNYTPELINFLTEWITYNINSQTKEWQKRNKMNKIKKQKNWSDEDFIERVRKTREKKILKSKI